LVSVSFRKYAGREDALLQVYGEFRTLADINRAYGDKEFEEAEEVLIMAKEFTCIFSRDREFVGQKEMCDGCYGICQKTILHLQVGKKSELIAMVCSGTEKERKRCPHWK